MINGYAIIIGLILVLNLLVVLFSFQLPAPLNPDAPGAAYAPQLFASVGILLSIFLLIQSARKKEETVSFVKKTMQFAILGLAYLILTDWIGFVISTIMALIVFLRLLEVKSWKVIGFYSLGLTCFIYLMFAVLLSVPIP